MSRAYRWVAIVCADVDWYFSFPMDPIVLLLDNSVDTQAVGRQLQSIIHTVDTPACIYIT